MPLFNTPFNTLGADAAGGGAGVALNNVGLTVYSDELLLKALPIMRFDLVVTEKLELGAQAGEAVRFVRYNALQGSSTLNEYERTTAQTLTTGTVDITVAEHGMPVEVSELRLRTSFTNVMRDIATQLGRHYAVDYDGRIRDVLDTTPNNILVNNRTDRSALVAGDTLDVVAIREATVNLEINKAPKFQGDAYICYIHPNQGKSVRADPEFQNLRNYTDPSLGLKGEIGRIEDVRFVTSTQVLEVRQADGSIFADGTDTGNDEVTFNASRSTYRAIIVGDHAIGHVTSLPVELRAKEPDDYNRLRGLMWYAIDGFGLIEPGHVFTIESA